MIELDYVVIGHATRDLKRHSFTVGGTAAYAARTAQRLGCRVGVITSADPALDLSEPLGDLLVARLPAEESTTFENIYTNGRRQQVVHATAQTLVPAMVPEGWHTEIVHLGPVVHECDPSLIGAFGEAFVGVTPQGWMRQWDGRGLVSRRPWREAQELLPHADAVVLSVEDLGGDRSLAAEYAAQTRTLALTQGAAGCTIYAQGEIRHFAPPAVTELDATGAGDIFAASFFCALQRGRDPWAAARFANCIAAQSVTRLGLSGTPNREEVTRCRQTIWGDEAGDAHHLRAG